MDFTALHHQPHPLLIANVWDAGSALASLGVRRISMGNFVHAAQQQQLQDLLCRIQSDNAFTGIFAHENHG